MSGFDENALLTRANSRVGTVVRGKYTIDSVLGVGGMATVFAVTHQNSQRYALKLLHPELALIESVRKRFVREGYAANNVDHDGVVTVFDNDVDETGSPFLLMELLEGASVNSLWLPPNGHMPIRETLGIAVQVLDVLCRAHQQGTIHRDIKPSNLFVTTNGVVKVLDFGIAQLRESAYELTQTKTGTTLGTPSFMAPEQARAKVGEIDARTDIWAVGATLFTMLSGKFVHEGDNPTNIRVIAATESARSLASVAPDIPSQVVHIVDKALAFEKESRFESAAMMRDAAQGVLRDFYGELSTQTLASFVKSVRDIHENPDSGENRAPRVGDSGDVVPSSKAKQTIIETAVGESRSMQNSAGNSAPSTARTKSPMPANQRTSRQGYWIFVISILIGISAAAGVLIWMMSRPSPGKVTVFASTDMSIPADFNWIGWTVKSDDGKIIENGAMSLSGWKQFPLRLVDIVSSDVPGLVRLDIEARRDGERGRIVLEQELQFQMLKEGEKTLVVPLDLLCSEDASPTHCKTGRQCRAGECVDIALTESPLVFHGTTGDTGCFNAAQCFASGMQITIPVDDPTMGRCVIKNSRVIFNGENQNVGLVVNTKVVGNFGVCGPSGQCIVPLDYDSSSGWQIVKKQEKVVGIRLPEAVCRGIGLNRLFGVAIVPSTPGCPPKSAQSQLCAESNSCIVTDGICPRNLPPSWIGYSCKGAASPQMMRRDLLSCFLPPTPSDAASNGVKAQGLWCCSTGEQPSDDALLIDDMSGGPQIKHKVKAGYEGGFWWTASDAVDGDFSPPLTPSLFTYRTISPPPAVRGNRTFDRAACFKSSGFSGWLAQMGVGFMFERGSVVASSIDISQYKGMRFWAYSPKGEQKIAVRVSNQDTFTEDPRSTCNQNPKAGKCGDDFGIQSLILTPEWKEYVVNWADFTQSPSDWGQARFESFDQTRVFHAYFAVFGRGPDLKTPPFEFCVSQLVFTR
jgi:serine/threonine protein kinase